MMAGGVRCVIFVTIKFQHGQVGMIMNHAMEETEENLMDPEKVKEAVKAVEIMKANQPAKVKEIMKANQPAKVKEVEVIKAKTTKPLLSQLEVMTENLEVEVMMELTKTHLPLEVMMAEWIW